MIEEPEKKPISRQRIWQLDNKAKGLCVICAKPRSPQNKNYCPVHREYTVMRNRINNARRRKFDFPYRMWEKALLEFTKNAEPFHRDAQS